MIEDIANIPRIYTAFSEWLACIVFIAICPKRIKRIKLIVLSGAFFIAQTFLLSTTGGALGFLWILFMTLAIGLMFLFIFIASSISVAEAGYYTIHAFVLAEFAASFEWQIHIFFWPGENKPVLLLTTLLVVVYFIIFFGIFLIIKRYMQRAGVLNITRSHLFTVTIIGVSVFAISNLSFMTTKTPFSGHYMREIFNIRTITDLCGLLLLGAYNIARIDMRHQRELDAVQRILLNQYEQYNLSKDNLEHINRRYHDLKHQIEFLKAEQDSVRRNDFLNSMEEEIKAYETQFKTGNPVLDTILGSKSMLCISQNIGLTCVADGSLLNFMEVIDICTVFGNALDNAIEHVQNIEDLEKRLIHAAIFLKLEYLVIRVENYMEGFLDFNGNFPATTKKDAGLHGYGLKSVQFVATKYNGSMTIDIKNNWFVLEVFIPCNA